MAYFTKHLKIRLILESMLILTSLLNQIDTVGSFLNFRTLEGRRPINYFRSNPLYSSIPLPKRRIVTHSLCAC